MAIDWDATGSMLSGIGTLIGAGAVVGAAWVGRATFRSWKAQRVEERRMDAAERILTLAYRLRYAFNSVRGRGIFEFETKAAEEKLDANVSDWRSKEQGEQGRMTTAQVILNRLNSRREDWQEIWTLKPVALALFGSEVETSLHAFWTHYVAVEVSASGYAEDDGTDKDFSKSIRRDLFGGKDDEVGPGVETAIASLEAQLLPILRMESEKLPR